MKFTLTNVYQIPGSPDPVTTYEDRCLRDSAWLKTLFCKLGTHIQVLQHEIVDNVLHLKVLVQPQPQTIPLVLRTLAPVDIMDYVQTTTYDFTTHRGTIKTQMHHPSLQGTSSEGTFILCATGPQTVTWSISSKVTSNFYLVGNKIEAIVARTIKKMNPHARAHIQAHLAPPH
ncbi:MAG: DUF2505 family protein [Myxococcota bacterium]|nr:DUF2505 family protein [Myxococcota bacterium]